MVKKISRIGKSKRHRSERLAENSSKSASGSGTISAATEGSIGSAPPGTATQEGSTAPLLSPLRSMRSDGATVPTRSSTQLNRPQVTLLDQSQPSSSVAFSASNDEELMGIVEETTGFQDPRDQEHWTLHKEILWDRQQKYKAAENALIAARDSQPVRIRNDLAFAKNLGGSMNKLLTRAAEAYLSLGSAIIAVAACAGLFTAPKHSFCERIDYGDAFRSAMILKYTIWFRKGCSLRNTGLIPACVMAGAGGRFMAHPTNALGLQLVDVHPDQPILRFIPPPPDGYRTDRPSTESENP
jgi:hypothetical protein